MNSAGRARWVAQTAAFLALLIVLQAATRPLGNTIVTGSLVNMTLILTVLLCGISSGVTLALVSPVFATLIGIGPMWPFVPFIACGNLVLIVLWHLIAGRRGGMKIHFLVIALAIAAAVKFAVVYFGVVRLLVPVLLKLPDPQASVVSFAFSWPQIITAIVGGVLAILLTPLLKRIVK